MNRTLTRFLLLWMACLLGLPKAAEAKFVFNHNHPDLDWYTIETEHFSVHYPVSRHDRESGNEHALTAEWSARRTAQVAEEMWQPMCEQFNYYLKERVHIVIINQSDYLEGFTIPSWDWIEVSANVGGYFWRMRGRMEWFSDVMVHEFAHVVSLKANSPFGEGAGGALIGGLYSNGIMDADLAAEVYFLDSDPFWWSEGGAEYWSDQTGYNWWTSSRDMNIRMTTLEDRLLTYDEWTTRVDKRDWGDGERGYQQGYSMALYLRQRFGDETFGQFALEYGKGWRPVTGVSAAQVYEDWVVFLTEQYEAVQDGVREAGEVVGNELDPVPHAYRNPDDRDEWLSKLPRDREDEREATGSWVAEPRVSEDGRFLGLNNRGRLTVTMRDENSTVPMAVLPDSDPEAAQQAADMTLSLGMEFGHGWDFIPGSDAVVFTGNEDIVPSFAQAFTHMQLELDGYDWKQLWTGQLSTYERDEDGREFESLMPGEFLGVTAFPEGAFTPIPNTLRGTDPAVSPDGERVAYFEYTDGTLNLVTINLDGSDKTHLTSFADGTWMQKVDWSPDGTRLVLQIFRNFQYNLWTLNPDGSDLQPLMWDRHEEMDAHWGHDGRIYFSADPDGIFNIFALDPDSGQITQLTNVVGGAQQPVLTADGNLLFTYYTAHGIKLHGLSSSDFYNRDATGLFQTEVDADEVTAFLGYSEDLSHFAEVTTPYSSVRSIMPPTAVPMLLYSNDSLSNWGVQGGAQFYAQDFVENHTFLFQALLGEDIDMLARYDYQGWYPNFFFMARHLETKYDYGYAFDEDADYETQDDVTYLEGKNAQYANIGAFGTFFQPTGGNLLLGGIGQVVSYGFKGTSDAAYEPYMSKFLGVGLLNYSTISGRYYRHPNPRGGRVIDLTYTRGFTDVVYEPYYGVDVDDGEELDSYWFNQYELRWTEQIAVDDYINRWLDRPERDPTIQLDMQVGFTDRNVQFNDEFRGGGRHPYFWGSGAIQPNTQFAGYPAYSLSGENMVILNAAYRFPIRTKMNKKIGPLYLYDLYAQVMGTAGNLWSYRPPTDPDDYFTNRFDDKIAYNPEETVVAEVPFRDYAYKNNPDPGACEDWDLRCTLLYDVGVELRLSGTLFNSSYWNSFLRVAYGFNEIRGIGDVNGDDFTDTSDSTLGDSFSNETEIPGVRVYLGLGTGW